MRVAFRLLVCACVLVGVPMAPLARAQDTLVLNDRVVGAFGSFGADLGAAPADAALPLAGGGRYSVSGPVITDRRTGASVVMDPSATLLAVDPVRPRLFVRSPGVLFSAISEVNAVTGASRVLTLVGASQVTTSLAVRYAYSVDRLYLDVVTDVFAREPQEREVQVFDGTTGARLPGGFTFAAAPFRPWLVTPEGDFAYVIEGASLVTIDLATGARRILNEPVTNLQWDPLNERLFVAVGGTLFVLNRQGDVLGSAAMGDDYCTALSPHTGRLYVRRSLYSRFGLPKVDDLRVFDSRTYTLLDRVFLSPGSGCWMSVFTAPGPPRRVQASVTGHTVSLSWVNVGAASHFVLEAGLAPGRTDLQIGLGADPRVTFTGVPSGIYHLRVRGGNEFGGGRASDELRLVVS